MQKKFLLFILWAVVPATALFSKEEAAIVLHVATFNLRFDTGNDGMNAWKYRKERVKDLIRFYDFDILGTQEGLKHQLLHILELPAYACFGAGRDDGKEAGEHSAIFYKKGRFELLDAGNFWFSENPDIPGKGWDAVCCNRICSWVKLRDKKSRKAFAVFNVHYDHEGKTARKNSSLLLLRKIKQIAGDLPVFCTGDFNATPEDEPIQLIYNGGFLKDAYRVTEQPPYGTEGTFNAFNPASPMKDRIDYIWVTEGIHVNKYGVLNEQPYGRFPSDHFPVMIRASF